MSQIVTTYTRDHTFAMKDLTIKTWNRVREEGELTEDVGKKAAQLQVYLKLRGKIELGVVGNLAELEGAMALGDVVLATWVFLTRDGRCTYYDVQLLLEGGIKAYTSLEIPLPRLSRQGFVVHHARCTRLTMFRGHKRSD